MSRTDRRGRPPHPDILTPAEWRVVEGVRHGLGNARLAARLGVSPDAVKFHVANALHKLGFTSRTQLRQWAGRDATSALAKGKPTMSSDGTFGRIGQISRSVKDIEASRRWYEEVLGLKHLYSFGDLAFFDCDGVRLFLSASDGTAGDSILYFRVGDIHAAHERLSGLGVTFVSAPHRVHRHEDGSEEWMAFFNDPDGGVLALMAVAPAP